jgi:hypothetical protein
MKIIYCISMESSWTVIVVTALMKEDKVGGQGHASASLLHQPATWHCAVNTHCFYMSAWEIHCHFNGIALKCQSWGRSLHLVCTCQHFWSPSYAELVIA